MTVCLRGAGQYSSLVPPRVSNCVQKEIYIRAYASRAGLFIYELC
jgi:hypothetical protein